MVAAHQGVGDQGRMRSQVALAFVLVVAAQAPLAYGLTFCAMLAVGLGLLTSTARN